MKLCRFGNPGTEKPGIVYNSNIYDCSTIVQDFNEDFFADPKALGSIQQALQNGELETIGDLRLGPPIARSGKIICIGLNYRKHALESGMEIPEEPVVFFKATSSITGPYDHVIIPRNSTKTDWEVELAVIIGKRASYVSTENALDHVFGYCVHNDVSEREFQLEKGGQWVKGKSCDTFAPLGPYIVTKDEIQNPNNLGLWLKVNNELVQNGSTSDFIFKVQEVISYLSQFMSLMPGDIISTGTPEGVGFGFTPPRYLKAGDVMELGIEGLGSSRQVVKDFV